MKKFLDEFKAFISRGNVLDMAVGIIIGGAFTAIVTSVVQNLVTPLIGLICGGIDFSSLALRVGGSEFKIGFVVNAILTFLTTALVLFALVKAMNAFEKKLKKEKSADTSAPPPEPSKEERLLSEIRDLLKEIGENKAD